MKALEYVEGQPAIGGLTFTATRGAQARVAADGSAARAVATLIAALRLAQRGHPSADLRVVPGWRATYHNDDPRYEPDMWVAELAGLTLWAKRDDHPAPSSGDRCDSCLFATHKGSEPVAVVTIMLPEDY